MILLPIEYAFEDYIFNIAIISKPVAISLSEIEKCSLTDNEIQQIKHAVNTGDWSDVT